MNWSTDCKPVLPILSIRIAALAFDVASVMFKRKEKKRKESNSNVF
jgi:hypothetical protein